MEEATVNVDGHILPPIPTSSTAASTRRYGYSGCERYLSKGLHPPSVDHELLPDFKQKDARSISFVKGKVLERLPLALALFSR